MLGAAFLMPEICDTTARPGQSQLVLSVDGQCLGEGSAMDIHPYVFCSRERSMEISAVQGKERPLNV